MGFILSMIAQCKIRLDIRSNNGDCLMKPLFDINTLPGIKGIEKVPMECEFCAETFYLDAKYVRSDIKLGNNGCKFCSIRCASRSKITSITKPCAQCIKITTRTLMEFNKSKNGNIFCSRSCAAKFNNRNKSTGTRRSKFEIWIEQSLMEKYLNIEIIFNKLAEIGYELDIYIPYLKLAFEINGIFHYRPVYGDAKFASIIDNDLDKHKICERSGVKLISIDISSINNFTPSKGKMYLDEIIGYIDSRLDYTK